MAKPGLHLIEALRKSAKALQKSSDYQWGHMGSCNCGFLAQQITKLSKDEIHARAMQRNGDWNEQLNDYCPTSGLLMDDLISELLSAGLDVDDLKQLEKLSNPQVIKNLPSGRRHLNHNVKADVIEYFYAWAKLLETEITDNIEIDMELIPIAVTELA
jgi:hypothetical protein